MLWITRPHCHVDRTASAWLIWRFVDRDASFAFAADAEAAADMGGTPFDMRGVELGHHGGRCSFESIVLKYELAGDRALDELAAIVHEADLDDEKFATPEAPGLDAVVRGLGTVIEDDQELLSVTHWIYDGLYAWLKRGETAA